MWNTGMALSDDAVPGFCSAGAVCRMEGAKAKPAEL